MLCLSMRASSIANEGRGHGWPRHSSTSSAHIEAPETPRRPFLLAPHSLQNLKPALLVLPQIVQYTVADAIATPCVAAKAE